MLKLFQVLACLAIALVAGGGMKRGNVSAVTIATDDFNRANGSLGPNWVASPSFTGFTITSNTAGSNLGVFTISYWNPATNTFANDQSSQVTLLSGSSPGAVVRHQPGVSSGYMAIATGITAGSGIDIYKFTAGGFTSLSTGAPFTINSGDVLVLTVTGTTLVATVNGTTRNTITDSTYSSGSPGIAAFNAALDNWSGSPISAPSGDFVFTPTALYFMDPAAANDLGAGTFASPWKTPNHAVNCGDVILVKAGAITTGTSTFGTVSNCPSSTGGIDGTGGIYFATLLCAGTDLNSCNSSGQLWGMDKNNWSVQGFRITNPGSGSPNRAINLNDNSCGGSKLTHHYAIVNNIMYNVASAVHTDDCGVAGANGADYVAAVGNIGAKASNNSSFPEAAFDIVGPAPFDQVAGTHYYLYNNYTWGNNCGTCTIDSESFMFDAWDFHPNNNNTGVIANNISWGAQRYCIQFFKNGNQTITPTMKAYNNTCYNDLVGVMSGENAQAEISIATGMPWAIIVSKNIALQTVASIAGVPLFALQLEGGAQNPSGTNSGAVVGGSGIENILKASATSCPGTTCPPGSSPFNAIAFDANTPFLGTNIYTDPLYANTADLIANQSGTSPTCTGFTNTTACMGWNAATSTLTTPSVISDLTAACASCTGKGFQRPTVTCAANVDYPTWLKGIVYLQASGFTVGATITEKAGLVSKPCNM